MPRRRVIDPGFWSDKKFFLIILRACEKSYPHRSRKSLLRLARDVRLFFIGLWNFCDDEGRFLNDLIKMKGEILPFDADVNQNQIKNFIEILETAKRVYIYESEGVSYGIVVKFLKHQTINRPTPSKLPPPDQAKFSEWLTEDSLSDSGVTPSQVKLREVKLNKRIPEPPSAGPSSNVDKSKKTVEDFLSGKTGFGKGGKERDREFRDEVKRVCLAFIGRLRGWGEEIDDEKLALNKIFGLMLNLIRYGIPKIPKGTLNLKGHYTPPEKAIELINSLSQTRPADAVAELVDAFKRQPHYLP